MRRLHLSLRVPDVTAATPFFEALLGVPATDRREGFVKFLVDEPGLNLALVQSDEAGLGHLGMQVGSEAELEALVASLTSSAECSPPGETTCCYARSTKGWTTGPAGLPWELFVTHEYVEQYGVSEPRSDGPCCVPGVQTEAEGDGASGQASCCA
jgi:catechol 2,3-dioxygenase-like lactoylglutathione lyase family enzyme